MARLYKPTITRYADANGKRCRKGEPGARKKRVKSKVWRGEYRDADRILRTESLCSNKEAARQLLAELERKAQHERAGLTSPFEKHHKQLLSDHLQDFVATLGNGDPSEYVQSIESRCRRIIDGCGFRNIGDISASQVQQCLAGLKRGGLGQRTVNHYLQAIKQFSRWLVTDRRTNDNRLDHLQGGNTKVDVRRERRELTDGELQRLMDKARNCTSKRFKLKGQQRFTLYAAALGTGLRAAELGSLTPAHFDLESDPPTVRIDAADEKSRRGDIIPLPADLVSLLRPWIAEMDPKAAVWPGTWAKNRRAGKFMRADLRVARRKWIEEADSDSERQQRERSDFLTYQDSEGRYADFHALRHTYLSRLGRSGASPKAMQRLARHTSVELTLGRYTHANLFDLAGAVDAMPPLPIDKDDSNGDQTEAVALRATGTDSVQPRPQNVVAGLVAGMVAGSGDNHCISLMTIDDDAAKTDAPTGVESGGALSAASLPVDSDCTPLTTDDNEKREWMGIEPTWPLFRGHTGFEAQDGHQIRVHSPTV